MSDEPLLNGQDIQGNILPGFRRKHQLLIGYSAATEGVLRATLKILAPRVTSLAEVIPHRDQRKTALKAGMAEPEIPDLWINLALGASALDLLGDQGVRQLDRSFRLGMRTSITGDPWQANLPNGEPNPGNPANWLVGSPQDPLALFLILAFDDSVTAGVDVLLDEISATGIEENYRESGVRLENDKEHFGFVDGISQVGVRGNVNINGELRPITARYGVPADNGVEFGRPGQPLVWPGQFLVGAPVSSTQSDGSPERYRNGSFLVFRRLSQDVQAFLDDTEEIARGLTYKGVDMPVERLRALLVGRWRDGAALIRHVEDPGKAEEPFASNYFAFANRTPDLSLSNGNVTGAPGDPAPVRGLLCPGFAHIRKVNPRDLQTDLGGPADTRGFQMLRRGIPFGQPYDRVNSDNPVNNAPRGLLFLAYQRAPAEQFDKLNSSWMNIHDGPTAGGHDLFIGQNVSSSTGLYGEKTAELYEDPAPAPAQPLRVLRNWVVPTGGGYLFAPSIAHITDLAAGEMLDSAGVSMTPSDPVGLEFSFAGATQSVEGETMTVDHQGRTVILERGGRKFLEQGEWPWTALLRKQARAFTSPSLTSLDLSGEHFAEDTLNSDEVSFLSHESKLKHIKLDGITLDGSTLPGLVSRLPRLRDLNLAGLDIDDTVVGTLVERCPLLHSLNIGEAEPRPGHRFSSPRITTRVVAALTPLRHLSRLSLRSIPVDDPSILNSDLWDRLSVLNLSGSKIGDASVGRLARSPKLRELTLDDVVLSRHSANELLRRAWVSLSLADTGVTQEALRTSALGSELRQLKLAGLELDDGIAELISNCTNLIDLDLSRTRVSDHVADAITGLKRIERLKINWCPMSLDGVARLPFSTLKNLEMRGVAADMNARRLIAESPQLQSVVLSVGTDWRGFESADMEIDLHAEPPTNGDPPLGLAQLRLLGELSEPLTAKLGALPSLRWLAFSSVAEGVRFSAGFPALAELFAPDAGINDEVAEGLASLPSIQGLYLSGNPIGEALQEIQGNHIHTLELGRTELEDIALGAIATLPRLHCLDVQFSKVSADGVAKLAGIAKNLQSLALDASQVSADSVARLADSERFLELYLYGTEVNTSTIEILQNLRLRELRLIGTSVTEDAIPMLAAIPGLRTLSVGHELDETALSALKALRPFLVIQHP